ncbi:acetyl-CoA synthetase-like protein [Fistulina hepatica ATCC 64428]|uniref:Acetyl-CoA synthetase-like protein n=1 Tax=Fistulina hepatica ATCC 64428 TaxID=1128425 RepID=A0A0D7ALI8_9AGAR|nr:acetyl-CoA synthetase-like protein [Fistulina hepatica ATCC 64428]
MRDQVLVAYDSKIQSQFANHPGLTSVDLEIVEPVTSGGAHLPRELLDKFLGLKGGLLVRQGYGMSEASAYSPVDVSRYPHNLRTAYWVVRSKFQGGPLRYFCLASAPEFWMATDGAQSSVTGELLVSGPSVGMGYFDDPEATARAFQDGWYRTGDTVRVVDGLYFFFVDRNKVGLTKLLA